MADAEKVSASLTSEYAMIRAVVEASEQASTIEVVQEALCDWKLRRNQREQAIGELRNVWDKGIASGPATDGDQAFASLRDRLTGKFADRDSE